MNKPATELSVPSTVTRRAPVPVLFPKIELCVPTQVNLENKEVVVVSDKGNTGTTLAKKLRTLKAVVTLVTTDEAPLKVDEFAKAGNLAGVYFLPALDPDPDWENATANEWATARAERVDTLFHIARALPESAFLLCATRMGGLHGLINPENPLGGVVSGFTKSFRRERRGQLAKVIDFQSKASVVENCRYFDFGDNA